MALKSTIYKAALAIADIDHGYYADHALTLARHPSETDERMMVRLLALALNAHELQDMCGGDATLAFGAGLSDPDDPDMWIKDYTGATRLWVEVGQPEDKPLAKACQKADVVRVYAFHHAAEVWWKGIEGKLRCRTAPSRSAAKPAACTSSRCAGCSRRRQRRGMPVLSSGFSGG